MVITSARRVGMCISLKRAFLWRKYYSLVAAVSVALHIIQCHEIVPQTNNHNHTPGTAQVSSSPYGFCLTHPPTLCALAPLNTNIGRILRTCTPPQVPSSRYQPPAISPAPLYMYLIFRVTRANNFLLGTGGRMFLCRALAHLKSRRPSQRYFRYGRAAHVPNFKEERTPVDHCNASSSGASSDLVLEILGYPA